MHSLGKLNLFLRFAITLVLLAMTSGLGIVILLVPIPVGSAADKASLVLMGTISTLSIACVGWWFTSSLSGQQASATIESQGKLLATTTPPLVMNKP